jgi:hypothetical protein
MSTHTGNIKTNVVAGRDNSAAGGPLTQVNIQARESHATSTGDVSIDNLSVNYGTGTSHFGVKSDVEAGAGLADISLVASGKSTGDATVTIGAATTTAGGSGTALVEIGSDGNFEVTAAVDVDILALNQLSVRANSTNAASIASLYSTATYSGTTSPALTTVWATQFGGNSAADIATVQIYAALSGGVARTSYIWIGAQGGYSYDTHETVIQGKNLIDISVDTGDITIGQNTSGDVKINAQDSVEIDATDDSYFTVTYASSAVASVAATEIAATISSLGIAVQGSNTYTHNVTIAAENSGSGNASVIVDAKSNVYLGGTSGYALDGNVHIGVQSTSSARTIRIGEDNASGRASTIYMRGGANIYIATEAYATTIDFGTGAAAQTLTLGSTNTTSSTTVQAGSGNIFLDSGGGIRLDDTNRSGWTQTYITLSDGSADWTDYKAAYGEVSIMGALAQTATGGWTAIADEAIAIGDAICGAVGTNDRVNQSDANGASSRQFCIGFAVTAAAGAGNTLRVKSEGLATVTCPTGEAWVRGDAIFLNTSSGEVTRTPPSGSGDAVQQVGWAAETNNTGTSRSMFIMLGDVTLVP